MTRNDLIALCSVILVLIAVAIALCRRLWQPHTGHHVPGAMPRPPLETPGFYGSMSLADEQRIMLPRLGGYIRSPIPNEGSWRETMERELAPEALDHDESTNVSFIRADDDRCISCGAEVDHYLGCPDDPDPDYEAEAELPERLVNVPRPGSSGGRAAKEPSLATMPGDHAGPGHPVADLLAAMSDDDFWYAVRFELRALAWMASEPFKLPAWGTKAIAA